MMLKRAIILLMLFQTIGPMPRKAANKRSSNSEKTQENAHSNPRPTSAPVEMSGETNPSQTPSQKHVAADEQKTEVVRVLPVSIKKDWADYLYIGASLLITIATLIIALSAVRQASAARTTADAAKATAEATRAQIEAIITGSRPWLVIKKIGDPHLVPLVEEPDKLKQRFANCEVSIENCSKTPARVIAMAAELRIGESPGQPPGDIPIETGQRPLLAESYIFPPGNPRKTQAVLRPNEAISPEDRDDILYNKVKFLWLWGSVRYRDTFSRNDWPDYELAFCYLYETRTNLEGGTWTPRPAEHNRET